MNKILALIIILGVIAVLFFHFKPFTKLTKQDLNTKIESGGESTKPSSEMPNIISTSPDLTSEPTIIPTQVLTFTFNTPLQNPGEFKIKFDPDFSGKYDIKLSGDKKVATVTPTKPFSLGMLYNITIGTDSKFDNKKRLEHEFIYHFKTIQYKGV